MLRPLAFLSYTRKDDEFFGGYISAFRKSLENAVHVVTGERSFQVFQDIEGIVIGENWQKTLDEVIHDASVLVPMLSPLFFNSEACRTETNEFLEHERSLKRRDLILPIYFVTTPKFEKEEKKAEDPLATELAKRQLYDWRTQANVPLNTPESRQEIMKLAGQVDLAIGRIVSSMTPDASPDRGDPTLTGAMELDTQRERLSLKKILWVDDHPENNIPEREALEAYGVHFELALDTAEAEELLSKEGPFAAVISDVARADQSHAGYDLLTRVRKVDRDLPYFMYTAGLAAKLAPFAKMKGAQGLTADPDALIDMVVSAIR